MNTGPAQRHARQVNKIISVGIRGREVRKKGKRGVNEDVWVLEV
jgi:hypothetical protein